MPEKIFFDPILEERVDKGRFFILIENDDFFLGQGILQAFDIGGGIEAVAPDHVCAAEFRMPVRDGTQQADLEIGQVIDRGLETRLMDGDEVFEGLDEES